MFLFNVFFNTVYNGFCSLLTGFFDVAEFINLGKRRFLLYSSHRYRKNRDINDVTHWRCVEYHRNNCRARATTKFINGRERVRINAKVHTHSSEPFFYTG